MKHPLYLFSYLVMLPLAAAVFVIALFTGCVTIESVLKALLWLTRSTMTTETRNLAVVIAAAPLALCSASWVLARTACQLRHYLS